MQRRIQSFLERLGPLLVFILSAYFENDVAWIKDSVSRYLDDIKRLETTRGIAFTVKYVKSSRNAVMRVLSGNPLSSDPIVKLDSEGWPVWLKDFKECRDNLDRLRCLMTLLTSLRSITLEPVLETGTITAPWNGTDDISESELRSALFALGIKRKLLFQHKVEWDSFHLSTKRGPQGQAILNAPTEATLLPQELKTAIAVLGGSKLAQQLGDITDRLDILWGRSPADIWSENFPKKSDSLRKLSYFSDKEGKTRVIGIVDYWSQTALKPLHHLLNRLLKRISQDMTFNQNRFSELNILVPGNMYWSIDLSAATDRFPALLQKRVIAFLIGSEKADAWYTLLTALPFTSPKGTFKYEAGQPMGAYSSWPAMAISHHLLVQVAAYRAGVVKRNQYFKNYFLLGDDLVIAQDAVAREYLDLIKKLDMPFSKEKTHTSSDVFEFAKRWFYKGDEITGFAISGLMSVYRKYPLLHNFLSNQASHGWVLPISGHPGLIRGIFSLLTKRSNYIVTKVESMIKLYLIFDSLLAIKHKAIGQEGLQEIYSTFFERISLILKPAEVSNWIQSFPTEKEAFYEALFKSKYYLVEKDLYKFQTDAYIVNDKLYKLSKAFIDGLESLPEAQVAFLEETVSVVLNWNTPMVHALNALIDKSTEYLLKTVLSDPEEMLPSFILESGLSKYFVSKGVFSLRSSHSIALAESAVVKQLLEVISLRCKPSVPVSLSSQHDPRVQLLMSGFPILAIRGPLTKLVRIFFTKFSLKGFLIRRLIWTCGYVIFMGIISIISDFQHVLAFGLTIWLGVQALLTLDSSVITGDSVVLKIVGNIILHSFELILAACIVADIVNYEIFVTAVSILIERFWDTPGLLKATWEFLESFWLLNLTLLSEFSHGTLENATQLLDFPFNLSCVPSFLLGLVSSSIIWILIQWFLGI